MTIRTESLPVIRRPSRLGAVWLSFRTNWTLFPIPLVVGFILVSSSWKLWSDYLFHDQSSIPAAPMPLPAATFPTPPVSIPGAVNGQSLEEMMARSEKHIDWERIKSLTVYDLFFCKPLWIPKAIPQLESLVIKQPITDKQLIDLCEIYDLKSLTLCDSGFGLTTSGWRALSHETSLEYLEFTEVVSGGQKLMDAISLSWPPNLRTIRYIDSRGTSLERFDEWQELQHLSAISTIVRPKDDREAEEFIEVLREFPALKSLFVVALGPEPSASDQDQSLARLQMALRLKPNASVTIRSAPYLPSPIPSVPYNASRVYRAGSILGFGMLIVLSILTYLSTEFATTARSLAPRFVPTYVVPIVGILVLLTLASFSMYLLADCSFTAAIGLCGAAVFILALEVRLMRFLSGLFGTPWPGLNNFATVYLTAFFTGSLGLNVMMVFGATVDRFLNGQEPWIAAIFVVGSFWGAFDLIRWQIGLRRELEDFGADKLPLSMFDLRGIIEWNKHAAEARRSDRKRINWFLVDWRIDRFMARIHKRKSVTHAELWPLASPGRTIDLATVALFVLFVSCCVVGLFGPNVIPQWIFRLFWILVIFPQIALIPPLITAFQRKSMMEFELILPINRREWAVCSFRWVATEVAAVVLVLIAYSIGFAKLLSMLDSGHSSTWSITTICLVGVMHIGIAVIVYAAAMYAMTLRYPQVFISIFFLVCIGFISCIVPMTFDEIGRESSTLLIRTIAAVFVVASLGLWSVWRRWQEFEVGRIT